MTRRNRATTVPGGSSDGQSRRGAARTRRTADGTLTCDQTAPSLTGLRLKRAILLVRHTDKHTSPAMETFLTLVRAAFADTGSAVG